uniref:hypothetical protein n=1 Tax=uncultured Flavobacterium sp. TaxID=165435 RepID=UPI0030EBDE4F
TMNKQVEKIEENHNRLREILRENGNEEWGDCIIDEICTQLDQPTTIDLQHLKVENLIIKTGNEAAKANFMNVDYDDDNPMTLADCITYFITESLPDDQDFDSSEIYDFIESKLKD